MRLRQAREVAWTTTTRRGVAGAPPRRTGDRVVALTHAVGCQGRGLAKVAVRLVLVRSQLRWHEPHENGRLVAL